jgi:hypothetical protein
MENLLRNSHDMVGEKYNTNHRVKSRLEYIANLCPFIGGEATYLCRGLIHLYNDEIIYDDEDACSTTYYAYRLANPNTFPINNIESNNQSMKLTFINNNQIKVYPNPASTHFYIEFNKELVQQYKSIELENILGNIILKTSSIGQEKIELGIQNYSDGMYQIKIKDKNQDIIFISKLNISK